MKTLARALVLGVLVLGVTACKKDDPYAIHKASGDAFFKEKKYAEAAEEYSQALAAKSNDRLWEKSAFAYMNAKQMDKAEAALLKLLDSAKDPAEKGEVYKKIANMYMQTGPITKVEQYFLEAYKINPKDESALTWLGEVYSQLGGARDGKAAAVPAHLDKAMAYYDQAITVNPASPFPYVNKRIALLKLQGFHKQEMDSAQATMDVLAKDKKHKDPAKQKELAAAVEEHKKELEALQVRIDELTAKLKDVNAAAKGGAPAPAAPTANPANP